MLIAGDDMGRQRVQIDGSVLGLEVPPAGEVLLQQIETHRQFMAGVLALDLQPSPYVTPPLAGRG